MDILSEMQLRAGHQVTHMCYITKEHIFYEILFACPVHYDA